jgi:hypothetical protein
MRIPESILGCVKLLLSPGELELESCGNRGGVGWIDTAWRMEYKKEVFGFDVYFINAT